MCKFSESERQKLGNTILFIITKAKHPYKTEILKLLYLMEERMVQQYHVPFLGIPFSVWRLGPVSVDVFEELSDGPVVLRDFISLQFNGQGIRIAPVAGRFFDDSEFTDNELEMMRQVIERYGDMNSEQLIAETHREGSLWWRTAKEHDLLQAFERKCANSSDYVIDMARSLCPDDREFYEETLNIRQSCNLQRLEEEQNKVC